MSASKQVLPNKHTQLAEMLAKLNIKVECRYMGYSTIGFSGQYWEHDAFAFQVYTKGKVEHFSFSTGIGHRFFRAIGAYPLPVFKIDKVDYTQSDEKAIRLSKSFFTSRFVMQPNLACLFSSLVFESQAIDESFTHWCDNYGYDEDSRKALGIYQACCDVARQLQNLFSKSDIQKMQDILADY